MSVKLISKTERLTYSSDGAKFIYKRVFPSFWSELKKKHTKRGMVDFTEAGFELLKTHILDWEGVIDETGKAVPFKPDLIYSLPDPLLAELVEAINGNAYAQEDSEIEKK